MLMTAPSTPGPANGQRPKDPAREAATKESAEVPANAGTPPTGLTEEEAEARLVRYGPNEVAREKHGWLHAALRRVANPLVILLSILAIITFATAEGPSDYIGGS